MATFRGKETAWISGRGLVIFGDVIEGRVSVGDILKWPSEILVHQSKVTGIELATGVDADGNHYTQSGIVLADDNEQRTFGMAEIYRGLIVTNVDFEVIEQTTCEGGNSELRH